MLRASAATVVLLLFVACDGAGKIKKDAAATDASADVSAACPAITGAGTMHTASSLATDETWSAAGSPHLLPGDVTIGDVATLTVEPCAEIRMGAARGMTVRGTLSLAGEAGRPVTIRPMEAGTHWGSIRTVAGGKVNMRNVVLEDGGDPGTADPTIAGMLDIRGEQTQAPQESAHMEAVRITGSASTGVQMREGGGFSAGSTDLTISGSASYPMAVWGSSLTNIPTGDYHGNARDEILIYGGGGYDGVIYDTTMRARGVPYHVGTAAAQPVLRVAKNAGQGLSTLTIEPGVTIRFEVGGVFTVEPSAGSNPASGALIAVGTADKPIVFTSAAATPAAGDWQGVTFGQIPSPTTRLDYVHVEYAGGTSASGSQSCPNPISMNGRNEAALRIMGGMPASAFITNSTVSDSAGNGIERGWRGPPIDFLPTNTFVRVAWCWQTFPFPTTGTCPAMPECPR